MRKLLFCLSLLVLLPLVTACAKEYQNELSVKELLPLITQSQGKESDEYSLADAGYLDDYLTIPDYVTDHEILFSTAGNDLDEIGVFHVTDGNANDLAQKLETYLKDSYEQNRDWYDSYMPRETPKLRDARVKVFGNYVVYGILSDADLQAAMNAVEKILKRQ